MSRIIPLTIIAGALAGFAAFSSAEAAPVSSAALGKVANAGQSASVVDQVYWRRHHRWWWRHHHHRRWW